MPCIALHKNKTMGNQYGKVVKIIHRNDYDLEFRVKESGPIGNPDMIIIYVMMIAYFGRMCYEYPYRLGHPNPQIVRWVKYGVDRLIEYKKEYDLWIRTQPNKDPDIIYE